MFNWLLRKIVELKTIDKYISDKEFSPGDKVYIKQHGIIKQINIREKEVFYVVRLDSGTITTECIRDLIKEGE